MEVKSTRIIPKWLFIGTFPTCYVYADMRIESNGNYKEICRLFFNPVRLQIITLDDKYAEAIGIAKADFDKLREKAKNNEPIEVSASGQTLQPTL